MSHWIGPYIIFCGAVHSIIGYILFKQPLRQIFTEGFFNKVIHKSEGKMDRFGAAMFMILGFWWFFVGHLVIWINTQGLIIPSFVGWYLIALNLLTVMLLPKSGFWGLIVPGIYIILN